MSKSKTFETLNCNCQSFLIRQTPPARIREARGVLAVDIFSYKVNHTLLNSTVNETYDMRMTERRRNIDLPHEPLQRLIVNGHFRKQGLDCNGFAGCKVSGKCHTAHTTAAQDFDNFV